MSVSSINQEELKKKKIAILQVQGLVQRGLVTCSRSERQWVSGQSAINPLFLLITSYDTPGETFSAPLGRQTLAAFLGPIPCAHLGRQSSAISGGNLGLSVVINPFSLPPIGLKKNGHVMQFWSIETWEQAFSEGVSALKTSPFHLWTVSSAEAAGSVAAILLPKTAWLQRATRWMPGNREKGRRGPPSTPQGCSLTISLYVSGYRK